MDVKEFTSEYKRMCSYYNATQCEKNGEDCPMKNRFCDSIECLTETAIDEVEFWSKEHPIETRQSVFLEQHPNAKVGIDGTLIACPQAIDTTVECPANVNCGDCCREYWSEAVK